MWVGEEDCTEIVRKGWNEQDGATFPQRLLSVSRALHVWHDERFGGYQTKIREVEHHLADLLDREPTQQTIDEIHLCEAEISSFQRSRRTFGIFGLAQMN